MKKIFALLIIALAAVSASAQFRYGATVGAAFSTLHFKQDLIDVSGNVGPELGVQGEMMFPGLGFGLDIGLLYQMRGAHVNLGQKEVWASQGFGNENVMLHNITIPIDLRFKWTRMNGLEDYVAPFVFGGPVFSFNAGSNCGDAFKFAGGDLGIQAGLGFEILKRWQVQAAYNWGMTFALKTKILDDFSARSRYWSVRVVRFF